MKKMFFIGFLSVLIFFSAGDPRTCLAMVPTITFQVSGTYPMDEMIALGPATALTVPYPVIATINVQIQGAPPDTIFGVQFYPTANGCPEGQIRVVNCYPTDAYYPSFSISESMLQENGQAWKARPMVESGPGGQYAISGQITVTFKRIFTPVEVKFITVTSPAANAVFHAGMTIHIAWTSRGAVGDSVKIMLVPAIEPQAAQVIAASTANNGAYAWRPTTGFPGKVWLEVQSLDGKVTGKSRLFTINH